MPINSPSQPQDHQPLAAGTTPTPWVAATELQPNHGHYDQEPLDALDEMSMESFPCSDPPCHGAYCDRDAKGKPKVA